MQVAVSSQKSVAVKVSVRVQTQPFCTGVPSTTVTVKGPKSSVTVASEADAPGVEAGLQPRSVSGGHVITGG